MDRYSLFSMWPHASTMSTITSSIADQIESNTCPICFELMKSPDFSPILLSPCGHTFCAKCVSRHVSIHEKQSRYGGPLQPAPCPYCRQNISSQTLNISLQKMITSILSLQETLEKADADTGGFRDGFLQAQTRCEILQSELQESMRKKDRQNLHQVLLRTSVFKQKKHENCQDHQLIDLLPTVISDPMRCRLFSFKLKTTNRHIMQRMEREIAQTDEALIQLRAKEEALEESIRKTSSEHQKVLTDLMDTRNKSTTLKFCRDEIVTKLSLIQASLFALEQVLH
uniref:RING-type domain-containing protein n=1 Tax=Physcomitrium patens TaxID=3218 RepID=A0A7I4E021_PHYPA